MILLLVLVGTIAAQLVCNNTDYADYYFNLCLTDPECKDNLHLHSDEQWIFNQMLNQELLAPMALTPSDICNATHIWLAVLRTYNPCYPNHFKDSDGYCVLFGDKLKDPSVIHRTGFAGLGSPILMFGVLVIVIWLAARQLNEWNEIRKRLDATLSTGQFSFK